MGLAISSVPRPGAHDNEELGRLHEYGQVPLLHQEAANDRSENQQNSDNGKHSRALSWIPDAGDTNAGCTCPESAAEHETPPESLAPCIGGRWLSLHIAEDEKKQGVKALPLGKLEHS